jgi:hypothetical protein
VVAQGGREERGQLRGKGGGAEECGGRAEAQRAGEDDQEQRNEGVEGGADGEDGDRRGEEELHACVSFMYTNTNTTRECI